MALKITSLGSWASWGLKGKKHFSLLIEWKGKKIWLDPAVSLNDKVDYILLSSPDEDHYRKLDDYLKKYPDTPVLSTIAILSRIKTKYPGNLMPFTTPLKIDGLKIIVLAIPLMVGEPACAFKFETSKSKVGIVPEFDALGKQEILYLKNTNLIIGIGEYDKRKPKDHKATFKELIEEYLPKIKPKSIYLTNFRINTYKEHKDDMIRELKEWNGKLLSDDEILEFSYEIIGKWHIPYTPEKYTNKQLMDDARLLVAVYSKLKDGKRVRLQEGVDEYFTEEILFNDFVIPLYKEIIKRVKEGKMKYHIDIENADETYKDFLDKLKKYISDDEISILIEKKSSIKPGYYSTAKPVYRMYFNELEDNLKSIHWDEQKLLVDTKWDGLRMTIGKSKGKGWAYVDPEGLKKKSPNISNRIPAIIKEIEDNFPDNTVLDGEFLAIHPNKKEMLHRVVANSILNSNMSGKELEDFAVIFIFDVLFYDGQDLRSMPLHERLEYHSRLKSTQHIWIEKISTKFPDKADGFIVNGNEVEKIKKISDFLRNAENGRPKYCAEGVMLKRLDWQYEYPQNHGWAKTKYYSEIDLRVIDKKKVKGATKTWNYIIGYDTPRDFAEAYLNMTTKDWYGKVYVFKDGKVIANGKDAKQYLDGKDVIFVTKMGKTDNTNIEANTNDIIRIAAEEVLKYDNPKDERYPRYSFYIGRVLEPIPEKNITDSLDVIDKLSQFEPQRIPIDELRHIKENPIGKHTFIKWGIESYKVLSTISILEDGNGKQYLSYNDEIFPLNYNDYNQIVGIVLNNKTNNSINRVLMFVDDVDNNKEDNNA